MPSEQSEGEIDQPLPDPRLPSMGEVFLVILGVVAVVIKQRLEEYVR